MSVVSQDALTAQVKLDWLHFEPDGPYMPCQKPVHGAFYPVLQREDGSYIGTNGNNKLIALAQSGGKLWEQLLGSSPLTPLYALDDGSSVATSTQPGSGQLGTLYTVDQNGNLTSQTADTGTVYSWTGQW